MEASPRRLHDGRAEPRSELCLEVSRLAQPSSLGWTRDISPGGLRIEANVAVGQHLQLKLAFPRLLEPVRVEGAVVWSGALEGNCRRGCGVQVRSETDRQTLHGLLGREHAPTRSHRVLIADAAAHPHPTPTHGLQVHTLPSIADARELRKSAHYDTVLVDALLRDERGDHVLTELLIGNGDPYAGMVVAIVRDSRAERLSMQLGADGCIPGPVDYSRWIGTLGHLLKHRSRRRARRVGYL